MRDSENALMSSEEEKDPKTINQQCKSSTLALNGQKLICQTICLSVFDHFMNLTLKGLRS